MFLILFLLNFLTKVTSVDMSSKGGKGEERRRRRTMHLSWGRLGLRCQMHAVEMCTHQTKIIKNKLRINLKLIREVDPSDGEKRVLRMLEEGDSKEKREVEGREKLQKPLPS